MNILTDEEGHRAVNGCKTGTTREIFRAVEAAVLEKLSKVGGTIIDEGTKGDAEPVAWMNAKRDMSFLYGPYNKDDIPLVPSSALAALQQEVWLLTSTEELLIKQSEKLVEQRDALRAENERLKIQGEETLRTLHAQCELCQLADKDLRTQLAQAQEHLSFIERWAVHHGTKPHMTPDQALSVIQHYPPINAITKGYADGKTPDTPNPWEQLSQAQADAARYKYLKENHSYHYSMQPDSPAEHGIEYQWQQGSYEERYQGLDDSIDAAIDASMKVMEDEC